MAANLLNSPQAVQMSVFVIRAFIRMRSLVTDTRALANKLAALEKELTDRLDTQEVAITDCMSRLFQLLDPPPAAPPPPDKELGFHTTLTAPERVLRPSLAPGTRPRLSAPPDFGLVFRTNSAH